jgi:hypothetical protein
MAAQLTSKYIQIADRLVLPRPVAPGLNAFPNGPKRRESHGLSLNISDEMFKRVLMKLDNIQPHLICFIL